MSDGSPTDVIAEDGKRFFVRNVTEDFHTQVGFVGKAHYEEFAHPFLKRICDAVPADWVTRSVQIT